MASTSYSDYRQTCIKRASRMYYGHDMSLEVTFTLEEIPGDIRDEIAAWVEFDGQPTATHEVVFDLGYDAEDECIPDWEIYSIEGPLSAEAWGYVASILADEPYNTAVIESIVRAAENEGILPGYEPPSNFTGATW